MKSRDLESIEVFKEEFGLLLYNQKVKLSNKYKSKSPKELAYFLETVGIGCRQDGFIWIVDPEKFDWLEKLFDIREYIPFARNSFDDIYLLNQNGECFIFNASFRDLSQISTSFLTTLLNISDKEVTDGDVTYKRHKEQWDSGIKIDHDTCYCLKPAIPLGGSLEDSEIYVGKIKNYFDILAQSN